jgi:adenosylcobinamide hydrolase
MGMQRLSRMRIEHDKRFVILHFDYPLRVLSSAPFNGGSRRAGTIVNLKTETREVLENSPEELITAFLMTRGLRKDSVGLLTSADMEYAQFVAVQEKGITILAVVTAGASNALNIAERSDTDFTGEDRTGHGTINIIVLTNCFLLDESMVSSFITVTEGKTAALLDLGVKSVVTGTRATGTGTDTVVIVSGNGVNIRYTGGHTLFGQLLGEAVYRGVKESLMERQTNVKRFGAMEELFQF